MIERPKGIQDFSPTRVYFGVEFDYNGQVLWNTLGWSGELTAERARKFAAALEDWAIGIERK
jgi:hypothetical protein